jgi:proteic killer suppression protein
LPIFIKEALYIWVKSVEEEGLRQTRTLHGYHDEPLKGSRKGQRSVRLSRAYRVIYEQIDRENYIVVSVLEVNKHDY